MVEKTLFAGPGFALSLAHIMQGGGAEAQTFFARRCLLGRSPGRRELCGSSTAGMDITSQPWRCCLPAVAAPVPLGFLTDWSKLNFNCAFLSDAHLNRLGRVPEDLAREKGEIFA